MLAFSIFTQSQCLKSQKSNFSQVWKLKSPDEDVRWSGFFLPWLAKGHLLSVSSCNLYSVQACTIHRALLFSFYKDNRHIRLGLTYLTWFYLNYFFSDPVKILSHYQVPEVRRTHVSGGGIQESPQHASKKIHIYAHITFPSHISASLDHLPHNLRKSSIAQSVFS